MTLKNVHEGLQVYTFRPPISVQIYTADDKIPSAILWMAVSDLDLACVEVGFIRPGDAEVGGVDMDAVGTEVGWKKAGCHDLVE